MPALNSGACGLSSRRVAPKQEWIVFLGWAPHPMNLQIDMTYLSGGDGLAAEREGLGL